MKSPPKKLNVITDRLLSSWNRCKRKAWLDIYGDKSKRIWSPHRALQLGQQYKSLKAFNPSIISIKGNEFEKGLLALRGKRLKGQTTEGHKIEGHPHLLQRIDLSSRFGGYAYIPVIAKQGKKTTREQRLSLALWALLLEQYQQTSIKEGIVVSLRDKKLEVDSIQFTRKLYSQLTESLRLISIDLNSKDAPPITSDRKKCTICSWKKECDLQALKEGNLSEISGIGAKRKRTLQSIGINQLRDLAEMDSILLKKELELTGEKSLNLADTLIRQAKAQRNLLPERINFNVSLPELANAPGVLIYDIESDPDINHDFLHGFVAINRGKDGKFNKFNSTYQPILSMKRNDEARVWKEIESKLKDHLNWPILHYGETELISLYRLAKKQNSTQAQLKYLKDSFIDIHLRVKDHWVLPLKNYSLKTVAKWIGFEWENKHSNGARALLWWRQLNDLKKTQVYSRSNNLNWIKKYNYDDCLATWEIAEWLSSQD